MDSLKNVDRSTILNYWLQYSNMHDSDIITDLVTSGASELFKHLDIDLDNKEIQTAILSFAWACEDMSSEIASLMRKAGSDDETTDPDIIMSITVKAICLRIAESVSTLS